MRDAVSTTASRSAARLRAENRWPGWPASPTQPAENPYIVVV